MKKLVKWPPWLPMHTVTPRESDVTEAEASIMQFNDSALVLYVSSYNRHFV
jgi:hypothetical protein